MDQVRVMPGFAARLPRAAVVLARNRPPHLVDNRPYMDQVLHGVIRKVLAVGELRRLRGRFVGVIASAGVASAMAAKTNNAPWAARHTRWTQLAQHVPGHSGQPYTPFSATAGSAVTRPPANGGRSDFRAARHRSQTGRSLSVEATVGSAQQQDDDHDDHHQYNPCGRDAHRSLAPPELRVRAIPRVATLRRRSDPVFIVIEAAHKPSLRA